VRLRPDLSSGDAVAMLGFMQALAAKGPQFIGFKAFGVGALFEFLIGAFLGAVVFSVRAPVIAQLFAAKPKSAIFWTNVSYATAAFSMGSFLVARITAGVVLRSCCR
jgi:hypothetical protein